MPRPHPGRSTAARILFESKRDGNFDIFSVNPDGTDPRNLTSNPGSDQDPAWSPGRRQIAFQSNRDGNFDIYVMNADGTGKQRLTSGPSFDVAPDW